MVRANVKESNPNESSLLHILLVDDDPLFGKIMLAIASKQNVRLTYFRSPREAYQQLPSLRFDVAIIDYHLGLVNGIQLSNFLENFAKQIPVVLISGKNGDQIKDGPWPNNIQDFISKTTNPEEILEMVIKAHAKHLGQNGKRAA